MKPYRVALYVALLATLVAVFWPQPEAPDGAVVVPASPRKAAGAATGPDVPASPAGRPATAPADRLSPQVNVDLFPGRPEAEPAAPEAEAVEEVAPEPPSMPPFPYQFVGRWRESGQEIIFLTGGRRLIKTRVGDVVDGVWQVRASGPDGLTIVYLPLEQETELRTAP